MLEMVIPLTISHRNSRRITAIAIQITGRVGMIQGRWYMACNWNISEWGGSSLTLRHRPAGAYHESVNSIGEVLTFPVYETTDLKYALWAIRRLSGRRS